MEPQCKVALLHNTPLYIGSTGARTCWDSGDKSDTEEIAICPSCKTANFTFLPQPLDYYECDYCNAQFNSPEYSKSCGPNDAALIDRVGNKFKHASILEHISYNFYISDISRGLLQELARHRMSSFSVKSTRYTLKELKTEEPFLFDIEIKSNYERTKKYLVLTDSDFTNESSILALDRLRHAISIGISNDKAKYALPESYKTELTWSINARSLQNFLYLRSDKSALWEIRELAQAIYTALPDDHKYLFTEKMRISEDE